MKIDSISIKSYRSCAKTNVDFANNLSALIGVNGVGKSNIMHAILLLKKMTKLQSKYARIKDTLQSKTTKLNLKVSTKDNKIVELKATFIFDTDERNIDDISDVTLKWNLQDILGPKISKWINIPIELMQYPEEVVFGEFQDLLVRRYFDNSRVFIENFKKTYPTIKQILDHFNSMTYYSASQYSDPTKYPNFIEIEEDDKVKKTRYRSNYLNSHSKFLYDLYNSKTNNDPSYNMFIDAVNSDGIGLIDKLEFKEIITQVNNFEVSTGGRMKSIERKKLLVIPNFFVDNIQLSPNQLSEGTLRALALIFYIISDKGSVTLVEEPEVCVHHGLLSSIINLIKFKSRSKQLIISTHSEYILDKLKPENIIIVKKNKEKGTIAKQLTKSLTKKELGALKKYLEESGNLGDYWKETGLSQY